MPTGKHSRSSSTQKINNVANTQHFFVLQSDPEIERCKQRLLEERTLSPDQRMKRILARVQDLCNAKAERIREHNPTGQIVS
jgi:hypothetical protein